MTTCHRRRGRPGRRPATPCGSPSAPTPSCRCSPACWSSWPARLGAARRHRPLPPRRGRGALRRLLATDRLLQRARSVRRSGPSRRLVRRPACARSSAPPTPVEVTVDGEPGDGAGRRAGGHRRRPAVRLPRLPPAPPERGATRPCRSTLAGCGTPWPRGRRRGGRALGRCRRQRRGRDRRAGGGRRPHRREPAVPVPGARRRRRPADHARAARAGASRWCCGRPAARPTCTRC